MYYDKCSRNTILCVICPIKLDCKFLEGKKMSYWGLMLNNVEYDEIDKLTTLCHLLSLSY